jgi:hypothetical protein
MAGGATPQSGNEIVIEIAHVQISGHSAAPDIDDSNGCNLGTPSHGMADLPQACANVLR